VRCGAVRRCSVVRCGAVVRCGRVKHADRTALHTQHSHSTMIDVCDDPSLAPHGTRRAPERSALAAARSRLRSDSGCIGGARDHMHGTARGSPVRCRKSRPSASTSPMNESSTSIHTRPVPCVPTRPSRALSVHRGPKRCRPGRRGTISSGSSQALRRRCRACTNHKGRTHARFRWGGRACVGRVHTRTRRVA
jgi:hypothetical protein